MPTMPIRIRALLLCAVYAALLFLVSAPVYGGRGREGDVLKIFNNQRVYVISNVDADAPALADLLLADCPVKERRVLTLSEWNALPKETRWYVTCVYLIDRERLAPWAQVPLNCHAETTENWTEVVRTGRDWGIAYDMTVSAPDLSNLRRAIKSFRSLKEPPRKPLTETVRSLAVVPIGDGAEGAAQPFLGETPRGTRPPHRLPVGEYETRQGRLIATDEVVLLDRSSAVSNAIPTAFAPVADKLLTPGGDVIAWRETKPGGYVRAYISAPTAGMLRAVLNKSGDNLLALAAFEKPTVLATARDLRPVRRVAVATVGGERIDDATANRIAGLAASELRGLNAFEVLERTALTTVLAEIALDQAGLTRGANRAKVQQLAAADALLIVDLSRSEGGTEYTSSAKRTTPPLSGPPRRPSEPSRLRTDLNVGGRDGEIVRVLAEGLLKGVVGTKTDAEYSSALREYRRSTLPLWERSVSDYHARADSRQIEWRQTITARSTVRVAGSLRLVDLADGLVLWEAPIASSDKEEKTQQNRTAYTTGESSSAPDANDLPGGNGEIPGELLARTAETAVSDSLKALPATALLPIATATSDTLAPSEASEEKEVAKTGKVIDVDGETVLIGLGASDSVKVGDVLQIVTAAGTKLRVSIRRVRPRTCDATFVASTNPAHRIRVQIGDVVKPVAKP
ncbi:MAG: hypothetical protein H7145_02135 [Akkermansiaceae bacterium]|nr:hypothetical protein [Armatimonadota bacterium]